MRILVDADSCPGRDIIEKVAKTFTVELFMYCDINHLITSEYASVQIVDSAYQSVDMVLFNNCKKNDIVVTGDYGVAAMVLGKGAFAINPRGHIYDNDNIEQLLFERHISQKIRRAGGKTGSHKKRNSEEDIRLENNLIKLIKKVTAI